jgi:hypothetical protein
MVTTPVSVQNKDIFSVSESTVTDNSNVSFNLTQQGTYIIKLVDKNTDQVLTKEKITGRAGLNTIKIYTRTLTVKYLYLVLCDEGGNQINKTTIITN